MPFVVPPWLATRTECVATSCQVPPLDEAIPWALITVPSPSAPTRELPFGLQLRGPFTSRAVAGSHLTRLSETR
jgi:hypothetical protein